MNERAFRDSLAIGVLDLPPSVSRPLVRAGLNTVGDVEALSDEEISAIPRLGAKRFEILAEALESFGGRRIVFDKPQMVLHTLHRIERIRPRQAPSLTVRSAEGHADQLPTHAQTLEAFSVVTELQAELNIHLEDFRGQMNSLNRLTSNALTAKIAGDQPAMAGTLPLIRKLVAEAEGTVNSTMQAFNSLWPQIFEWAANVIVDLEISALSGTNVELARARREEDFGIRADDLTDILSDPPSSDAGAERRGELDRNLTRRQLTVAQLFYRDGATQQAIARVFSTSQPAVHREISEFRQSVPLNM